MTIRTTYVFAAFLVLATLTGCASVADDYCNAYCDCTRCNDHEFDECVISAQAEIDVASAYGCDPEGDKLAECVIDRYQCVGNIFDGAVVECASRYQDLDDCKRHGSSLY